VGSYFAVALNHSVAPILKLHHANSSIDRSIKPVQQLERTLEPKCTILKKWTWWGGGGERLPLQSFYKVKHWKILNHCMGDIQLFGNFCFSRRVLEPNHPQKARIECMSLVMIITIIHFGDLMSLHWINNALCYGLAVFPQFNIFLMQLYFIHAIE